MKWAEKHKVRLRSLQQQLGSKRLGIQHAWSTRRENNNSLQRGAEQFSSGWMTISSKTQKRATLRELWVLVQFALCNLCSFAGGLGTSSWPCQFAPLSRFSFLTAPGGIKLSHRASLLSQTWTAKEWRFRRWFLMFSICSCHQEAFEQLSVRHSAHVPYICI